MSKKAYVVETKDFDTYMAKVVPQVDTATTTGAKRVAETYRDLMKKNYMNETHKSAYGKRAIFPQTSGKSMASFLVVSNVDKPDVFTVGPKKGGMYTSSDSEGRDTNMRTYEEIFKFQIKGYKGKKRRFRLRKDRQAASNDNGYWTVGDVKPKKYAEITYNEFKKGGLKTAVAKDVEPLIERSLKK